jgi:alpha-mannosidase
MNAYYLISADKLEQARQLAPSAGLPNQLFQYCISLDGTKTIVQADWSEEALTWLNKNGTFLGELQADGSASQGVYEELAKPDWQPPAEE